MSNSTAAARVPARPLVRPANRERPAQPRLRVVAPVTHRPATGLALLCVALLGGGLLMLLLLNISIGKGAYELTELQSTQSRLSENRQALAEQIEAQSAPQRLAAAAKKLGMVPAPVPAFVTLPDGSVEGMPAVAQPAPKPTPKPSASAKAGSGPPAAKGAKTATAAKTGTAGTTATTGKAKTGVKSKTGAKSKTPGKTKTPAKQAEKQR